jgi:hypothetical protein
MWRQLLTAPKRLGVTAAILLLAGGSLMTHGSVTSTPSLPPGDIALKDIALTASDVNPSPRHAPPSDDGGAVDLYGNEINDAIATYTLDPAGSLYELHSPQTELPRLGAPKS